VETNADLQVYDLAHLGLVAGIMDRMKLVETVDRQVGPRPNEKVSTGVALWASFLPPSTSSATFSRANPPNFF
jgi:hypothetical protein